METLCDYSRGREVSSEGTDMCDEVIEGRIGNSVSSGEGTEVHVEIFRCQG